MTFASEVKNEISKSNINSKCCAVAEIYGIFLVCTDFSNTHIKIVTENDEIAIRIADLFKKAFNIDIQPVKNKSKNIFELDNTDDIANIFNELGYDYKYYINFHLNRNVIDEECCVSSFLKGLFLISGVVASPDKKSHLEISTTRNILSREIMSMMLDCGMKPKEIVRKNQNVIYFKESSYVEDFLTRVCANKSCEKIKEGKEHKQLRNHINRQVNCETGNLSKVVNASHNQCQIIKQAIDKKGIEIFPEKLHITISVRLNNPELSLTQIGELHNPELSKSAVNHKMRKIVDIAQKAIDEN